MDITPTAERQIVSLFHASQKANLARHNEPSGFRLEVELIGGPIQIEHHVSRRLRISSEKTLHDLHDLLVNLRMARGRTYDFMFGAPTRLAPGASQRYRTPATGD